MATASRILTYEDWLQLPPVEDGTDEVVNGELRFMPPTRYPHAEIIRRLIANLSAQVDQREIYVIGSNLGLMISRDPLTCRSPDLVVYHRENIILQDGLYWSPPDLAVEVLSPSENRRRKQEKLDDYAKIGVPEAWIVSPQAQSIEVRTLIDGQLRLSRIIIEGTLEPTRFPGVSIVVTEIWPE